MGVSVGVMDVGNGVKVGEGVILGVGVNEGTSVAVGVAVCVSLTCAEEPQAESTTRQNRWIQMPCLMCDLLYQQIHGMVLS